MENLTTPIIVILVFGLCWAMASRAYWKRRAGRNGGVTLVCYSSESEAKSYRQINLKHFPGKLPVALENAHGFLDSDGFKQIDSSLPQVFARGNERVKIYFLNDGIVSEEVIF